MKSVNSWKQDTTYLLSRGFFHTIDRDQRSDGQWKHCEMLANACLAGTANLDEDYYQVAEGESHRSESDLIETNTTYFGETSLLELKKCKAVLEALRGFGYMLLSLQGGVYSEYYSGHATERKDLEKAASILYKYQ